MYSEGTKLITMETNKTHITICRIAYCEECYKQHKPSKQDLFVTIGRKHQKYQVRQVTQYGQRGFTPHIMTITDIKSKMVTYTSYCGIHECGCNCNWKEETEKFLITPIKYTTYTVTTAAWNAMLLYKDDEDFFLD